MAYSTTLQNVYSLKKITETFTSDGTGNVSVTKKYISGTLDVYVDGTLTAPSRITETGEKTYSISTAPRTGSTIITKYNPLS